MKRIVAIYLFTILSGIASAACEKSYTIHSPDRTIGITLTVGNRIAYEVRVDGRTVVAPTPVAMTLDDGTVWGASAQPSRIRKGMVNTSFATPFYIKKRVADHYNWLRADFRQGFAIELRAYDDGVAYRFISTTDRSLVVASEEAGARFPGDWTCWVPYVRDCDGAEIIPFGSQFKTSFENLYTVARLSDLDPARLAFLPLVVAADDGVMPQTIESINHAKAAGVPIVVAVNKIDKPGANPDRVRQELTEYGIIPEEWGGQNMFVNISAKQKIGIDDLLETVLLQADVLELKANPDTFASGNVLEAKLDKGRGSVATVLVTRGTLHVGDTLVAGLTYGRVRAMLDPKGNAVTEAGPSDAVEILGLQSVPNAGDEFRVFEDEREARALADERSLKARIEEQSRVKHVTLENLFETIADAEVKELNLIIKADVQGSIEALQDSLDKMDQSEVRINTIHSAVGAINETDVVLADASNAIIIGFGVRPDGKARSAAEREGVEIRCYDVIYKCLEELDAARIGMLKPTEVEVATGTATVLDTFKVPKVGIAAGVRVEEGEIAATDSVRLVRDGIVVFNGKIASMRHYKDEAKSLKSGSEGGIGLENFQDIKPGDQIEGYRIDQVARTE